MGAQRTSFGKRERDRAKKAKAAAKRERRQDKALDSPDDVELEVVVYPEGELSAAELLDRIEAVHRQFDGGSMTLEDFEEEKASLLARLPVD